MKPAWFHGSPCRFTMENLQKLCQFFNCQFSDIVEYIPEDGDK
ncbi:MAG: helix-turn-helix transcriptional regulator [Treponema sp.]|nr:helix-turn-helix transcriptional regulator [Treponema sp.]